MAVAALVLGILGTLLSIIPPLFYLGIPLALIGLILGIVARKSAASNQQPTGMATAGLVLGVIGLVIGMAMFALCSFIVHKGAQMANDPTLQKQYNKDFDDAFKKALEESQKQQTQQPAQPAPKPAK